MATPGKTARNPRPEGAPALLTSRDNHWLKEFRVALRGGLPTESGFVGVEGVRLVEEALRSGCRIQAVLFSESGERHHERLSSFAPRIASSKALPTPSIRKGSPRWFTRGRSLSMTSCALPFPLALPCSSSWPE